ncbi:hypothetical protein KSP39_PZI005234 [Platanthera zijinensis]|uniref:SprT-like domain-containing protein n=1 Tax=Platanthera zijinensis TaxID=2320716 RepID=A0AAP0GAZ5_9ASPA
MAEPPPDIHELFCHYNSLYFGDALGACIVSWDPRMTSITADCDCREPGLCEISLSQPLLKSCSSTDLKNVLLHEMIHAFLWITHNDSNHSDHGSKFWTIADLINSNDNCDDVQRPSDGYKITINHGFHDEVDTWSADERMFALVKVGTGREPSPSDCTAKNGHANEHDNLSCKRKKVCPDKYEGVDIISVYETKGKAVVEDVQEICGEGIDNRRGMKRPRAMSDFFSTEKSSENNFARSNQLIVMDERNRSLSIGANTPKQRRIPCWKKCNLSNTGERKYHMNDAEITLVMQIFGVCADEESEEESEPLINKRSERRKRMKFDASGGRCGETGLIPHEVICLDSSSQKSDYIELDQ